MNFSLPDRPACYAHSLGGCTTQTSDEHYVSEGVLKAISEDKPGNPHIYVRNLRPYNSGMKKKLDIGRLTAPILCTKHNSDLSPFDTAGKIVCQAAERLHMAYLNGDAAREEYKVDGADFERWMLKTLCSCLCSRKMWDYEEMDETVFPEEWLQVLFNRAMLVNPLGLYWQPTAGCGLALDDRSQLEVSLIVANDGKTVCGIRAWIWSLRFDLILLENISGLNMHYPAYRYRPSCVRWWRTAIRFEWADSIKTYPIEIR
jgi:hypothetical protein